MEKNAYFSVRLSESDRAGFDELARRLGRDSTGAAVRAVVRLSLDVLRKLDES